MSTCKSSMIVIYTLPGTGRYSDIVTTPTIWTQHIFFFTKYRPTESLWHKLF